MYSFHCAGSYVSEYDDGPGPEYFMESSEPSYSRFAFVPLTDGGRPCALNEEVPANCLYGMYHMDQDEHGCYNYWMDGLSASSFRLSQLRRLPGVHHQ